MNIVVCKDPKALGRAAAEQTASVLRMAIHEDGFARIILSTGASQFTTLDALVTLPDIDWSRVEMFHLDEYVGLPITHPASFRKYLQERFVDKTHVGRVHFVDGTPDCIAALGAELDRAPVHIGLIGIGQNAHIAFNDPPADFQTQKPYLIVDLDARCKTQQVHEGWFATVEDVPKQAVSMSVSRIMRCRTIISAVPYPEKASAVAKTLQTPLSSLVPATMLKEHADFTLYADADSYALVDEKAIVSPRPYTITRL